MKVQLEFEKTDLEEMLTLYFERSGFSIKNLSQLCEQFAEAFPEGIKVQAEILSSYEPRTGGDSPEYLARSEFEGSSEEDVVETTPETEPEPVPDADGLISEVIEVPDERLTHADLMDPTRPIPGNETKDMSDILRLVRQSDALARTR